MDDRKILERWVSGVIHALFLIMASIILMPHALAQRQDRYLYEKVTEQEKHLDNTDANVSAVRQMTEDNRETIGEYKAYFLGVSGAIAFLNMLGLIKSFSTKKEQHG